MKPSSGLAAALGDEAWEKLLAAGHRRAYERGQLLMRLGEPVRHVVFLLSGEAKVSIADANGQPLLLAMRGAGEVVGEIGLLGEPTRSATVTAITRCETHVIDAGRFNDLVRELDLETIVLRHLVRRLREDEQLRAATVTRPASLRVARGLLYLAHRAGRAAMPAGAQPEVRMSHADLAESLRLSRPTVTSELSGLRAAGIITTSRGRIVIVRIDELARRAGLPLE